MSARSMRAWGRTAFLTVMLATAAVGGVRAEDGAIYAPVYSHLWHGDLGLDGKPQKLLLAATVSVRNPRPSLSATILSIDYHDERGKLVRKLLDAPTVIPPLATLERFIPRTDDTGGSGASVVIRWRIDAAGPAPLVETLHAYVQGSQTLAFITTGRPLGAR